MSQALGLTGEISLLVGIGYEYRRCDLRSEIRRNLIAGGFEEGAVEGRAAKRLGPPGEHPLGVCREEFDLIDLARIPSAVLAMPFDLVCNDLLMDPKPLKTTRFQSIIDELFLPLVRLHNSGSSSTGTT